MMADPAQRPSTARYDLAVFGLGPALLSLGVAALYHLAPWPTPVRQQAANFGWGVTAAYLAVGAVGAALSSKAGCPAAPALGDRRAWLRLLLWSLAAGLASGAVDVAISAFTPWGAQIEAKDRSLGYTWANVALPWSLPHYFHASVLSECAFRLAAIIIPAWLVGRLLLKGRREAAVFWTFGVLAALIEPLEKAILLKRMPFVDLPPLDLFVSLEGVATQVVYALMLRRFGWPAPIAMRFGYYLLVRVFIGYLYPPFSENYPGPH
jgi:hypothetical protein